MVVEVSTSQIIFEEDGGNNEDEPGKKFVVRRVVFMNRAIAAWNNRMNGYACAIPLRTINVTSEVENARLRASTPVNKPR